MPPPPPLARSRAPRVPTLVLTLVVIWVAGAAAESKEFGFISEKRGGTGKKFTAAESLVVRQSIDSLVGRSFTIKGGEAGETTYSGSAIAADLIRMLEDGRLGKGEGADAKVYADTKRDGKTSADGDRMNVSDHHVKSVAYGYIARRSLARTLAHEWVHTHQLDATQAALEASAFQVGRSVFLGLGGQPTESAPQGDLVNETMYKKELASIPTNLPGSNAPSGGSHECGGSFRDVYCVFTEPGALTLTRDGASLGSFAPLPQRLFFTVHALATPGPDRVLVFGADTTAAGNPLGVLTVFNADSTHLFARQDLPLATTRHPSSVAYDPATRRWYVLDTHPAGSGITVWTDTNGDSVPDTRQAAAFAGPGFPGLSTARSLALAVHPAFGQVVLVSTDDWRRVDQQSFGDPVRFLKDQNGDGVADFGAATTLSTFVVSAPTLATVPRAGATQLEICGMGGHALQVWSTDAAGVARSGMLGSITPGGAGVFPCALSRQLVAGEFVIAVDATSGTQPAAAELVEAAVPGWGAGSAAVAGALLLLAACGALRGSQRTAVPGSPTSTNGAQ